MISAAARPYIDASVPVLREHGPEITRRFYSNMFAAHPELTNLFNMGNQASGVQQQSLAAAVFAYAANIDNAAALAPVINRIVHKHVSVGIVPAHYPIVGRHLLGAIQEVLGEAAVPPLMAAWDEAYTALADALTAAERGMYAQARITPGQFRPMQVQAVVQECIDVISYTLVSPGGATVPAFKPGQYVSVRVNVPDGKTQLRQYTLSDRPQADRLRITVKRALARADAPEGQVSTLLQHELAVGSMVDVSHPFGDFMPDTVSTTPIVLLSGGIGITPMIAVLNDIAATAPQRTVVFAHAANGPAHHAHRADIAAAKQRMPNLQVTTFYETGDDGPASIAGQEIRSGYLRIADLPSWPHAATDVYMCGPVPFMQAQWLDLIKAGVPATRLHREVFGPELLDVLA